LVGSELEHSGERRLFWYVNHLRRRSALTNGRECPAPPTRRLASSPSSHTLYGSLGSEVSVILKDTFAPAPAPAAAIPVLVYVRHWARPWVDLRRLRCQVFKTLVTGGLSRAASRGV
jgi:hypothetical protein